MTPRDEDVARAIRQRDVETLLRLVFVPGKPRLRPGFGLETELWDFKQEAPDSSKNAINAWAKIAKHVLAFHNATGGVLFFGISDSLEFRGIKPRLDSKLVNDKLRRFIGDFIWCEFHREFIQADQTYLGVLLIPPRGPRLERFQAPGVDSSGAQLFDRDESAIRRGDSSFVLTREEADSLARSLGAPTLGKIYEIDEPFFRILAADYVQFVERPGLTSQVEGSLRDSRVAITSLLGIGGAGKTALATWAVLRAYERRDFSFIVSTTAKDRELTAAGIQSLAPSLSSFEALLDSVLEVLGFPDRKAQSIEVKAAEVRELLTGTNGLLYVDNLETVDDDRIIAFLDNLPVGVRAITTSRRTRVRVSVRPVEGGQLTEAEVRIFVRSLAGQAGFHYARSLADANIDQIGLACDRLPLAIRWVLSRSRSQAEAMQSAESIAASGKRGEELLEFSFRRVYDGLQQADKRILQALSIFQAPLPVEAVLVGASISTDASSDPTLLDALEQLIDDALVQRIFDPELNDYVYTLLPITKAFVYTQVARNPEQANTIRHRLTNYFEARDISDPESRLAIRESRQGRANTETSLLDLAISASTRGDLRTAASLFDQALTRNPKSWRVSREFAEFRRHRENNTTDALRLYEQAAANAPRRGLDRSRIFREWGMLLRDSGRADATDRAIACFEEAIRENERDPLAAHALASMLTRKGAWRRVIELMEPWTNAGAHKTREMALTLLLGAYERLGELIKLDNTRQRLKDLAR